MTDMSKGKSRRKLWLAILGVFTSCAVGLAYFTLDIDRQQATIAGGGFKIDFGTLPYPDHTYAYVGKELGWFAEAGIDLTIKEMKVDQIIPWLKNNTVQVASTPPGILISAWDSASDLTSFVFGNLYTGYAVMAPNERVFRSYADYVRDFRRENETVGDIEKIKAFNLTISQLRGKRVAVPPEDAVRPFIDGLIKASELDKNDLRMVIIDDAQSVAAMVNRDVDFQVGGAPSRVSLDARGFKSIITSSDFLEIQNILTRKSGDAEAARESTGVIQNGWATAVEIFDGREPRFNGSYPEVFNYPEALLRMACVNYRIMKALGARDKKAVDIHIKALSGLTKQSYTERQVNLFYAELNKFTPFEAQRDWFTSQGSSYYFEKVNGSIINFWRNREGHFRGEAPEVRDVIKADKIYNELLRLKTYVESHISDLKSGSDTADAAKTITVLQELIDKQNFVDAYLVAKGIKRS